MFTFRRNKILKTTVELRYESDHCTVRCRNGTLLIYGVVLEGHDMTYRNYRHVPLLLPYDKATVKA